MSGAGRGKVDDLESRLVDTVDHFNYWDNEAPPMARLGNLRLWAAYAVTEAGLILDRQDFIDWALESQRAVLSTEEADGSLPYEMRRGAYALHYQLHALAPLAASAALLCHAGQGYSEAEQGRSGGQSNSRSPLSPIRRRLSRSPASPRRSLRASKIRRALPSPGWRPIWRS
ncbi:alginate lyase family protein [Martelella endophytica]|uniref:Alginate lyase domain-containing protein n=1 Tax=Martelella endophytica TaxID=1486262 RepID=A0A0D5LQ31_MAREN|nr:alginate lyase family protein [Martelella endophytica]AJY46339.1 hypothetical protein TM49_12725 [Martelella endophytica]